MKKLLVLGAGTAGTVIVSKPRSRFVSGGVEFVVGDWRPDAVHLNTVAALS